MCSWTGEVSASLLSKGLWVVKAWAKNTVCIGGLLGILTIWHQNLNFWAKVLNIFLGVHTQQKLGFRAMSRDVGCNCSVQPPPAPNTPDAAACYSQSACAQLCRQHCLLPCQPLHVLWRHCPPSVAPAWATLTTVSSPELCLGSYYCRAAIYIIHNINPKVNLGIYAQLHHLSVASSVPYVVSQKLLGEAITEEGIDCFVVYLCKESSWSSFANSCRLDQFLESHFGMI